MHSQVAIAFGPAASVTMPLPTYRALVEHCRQVSASERLITALREADMDEPVHLDADLKAVLLHAVSRWLDELPFAAWPAGLYELRNKLERERAAVG